MSARRRGRNPLVLPAPPSPVALALLVVALLGTLTLAGCGQMGPLVLPEAASQGQTDSDDEENER